MGDGVFVFWYTHLGHLNVKRIHIIQNTMDGINLGKKNYPTSSLFCEAYIEGKQRRVVFLNKNGREGSYLMSDEQWAMTYEQQIQI